MPTAVKNYEVRYRVSGSNNSWSTQVFPPDTTALTIPGLVRGTSYDAEARSVGVNGAASAWVPVNFVAAASSMPPIAPIGLALTSVADGVAMAWSVSTSQVPDAEYVIERAPDVSGAAGAYAILTRVRALQYTDPVTDAVPSWYRIRAVNYVGLFSAYSNAAKLGAVSSAAISAAANTALANAATAQTAANTAQTSANTANSDIANIVSDNLLTPDEKPRVIQDRDELLAEQSGIDAQATAYGVTTEKTTYDTAVTALTTYLATLTAPVLWTNLTGTTTIVGTTFRTKFLDVYAARQALLNKIYASAKTLADNAQTTGNTANSTANTALANAATAQTAANTAQTSANTANSDIANIVSDNLLTPDEKPRVIQDRDEIIAEQAGIDAQATAYSITTEKTTYDTAVSALTTYLATLTAPVLWSNTTGNTTIVGATFRTKFLDVYASRQALLNKIAANAKVLADNAQNTGNTANSTANTALANAATAQTAAINAQTSANTANAEIANIISDGVLSKNEKPAVIIDYTNIYNEAAGIDAQASTYGITTERTSWQNAKTALENYLTGLSPAWNDANYNTPIVPTTFKQKFNDYYLARQILLNKIYASAKVLADNAQTTANAAAANASTALANASTAQTTADGKIKTFYQTSPPTVGVSEGDIWFDTDDGNKIYTRRSGAWVATQDSAIATAINSAQTAQTTADGKAIVYYQTNAPTGLTASDNGDIWIDIDDNKKMYVYSHPSWVLAQDWYAANIAAGAAQATGNDVKGTKPIGDNLVGNGGFDNNFLGIVSNAWRVAPEQLCDGWYVYESNISQLAAMRDSTTNTNGWCLALINTANFTVNAGAIVFVSVAENLNKINATAGEKFAVKLFSRQDYGISIPAGLTVSCNVGLRFFDKNDSFIGNPSALHTYQSAASAFFETVQIAPANTAYGIPYAILLFSNPTGSAINVTGSPMHWRITDLAISRIVSLDSIKIEDGQTNGRMAIEDSYFVGGKRKVGLRVAGSGHKVGDQRNLVSTTSCSMRSLWDSLALTSSFTGGVPSNVTVNASAATLRLGSASVSYAASSAAVGEQSRNTSVIYYAYYIDADFGGGTRALNITTDKLNLTNNDGIVYLGSCTVTIPSVGSGGGSGGGGGGGGYVP